MEYTDLLGNVLFYFFYPSNSTTSIGRDHGFYFQHNRPHTWMCTEHMDLFLFCILSTNHCIGFLDLDLLDLWHGEFQVCVGPRLYFCLPQERPIGYWGLLFSWPRSFICLLFRNHPACYLTFGGMCCWRSIAVARVFALVVRCRVMMLFVHSRVGKNRDTKRESPAGAGAACAANHRTVKLSQKILAAQKPMTYTDLLAPGNYSDCKSISSPWSLVIKTLNPFLRYTRNCLMRLILCALFARKNSNSTVWVFRTSCT